MELNKSLHKQIRKYIIIIIIIIIIVVVAITTSIPFKFSWPYLTKRCTV
jgi:t-SNARE complex subunit (syntaxin)